MQKASQYKAVSEEIVAVLTGETNLTAKMATVSCLLSKAFPDTYYWTGFYVVDPAREDELVVGPYQGTLGCLRIPFGKGVCGTAAQEERTQIVGDVHSLENHIACDAASQSEIVVPVWDKAGKLIAVLDVDSTYKNSFDETDAAALEELVDKIFAIA